MKFRVAAGPSGINLYAQQDQLKTFYSSQRLIIQGDESVRIIPLDSGRTAYIMGDLLGIRDSTGGIIPVYYNMAALKELIQTNPIEKCRELLEGRFLLAVADPEDACCICVDRYCQLDLYYETVGESKIFTSDMSLLPSSSGPNVFDQEALAHALSVYGYRPPKRHTLFKDVRRLGVGESVHIADGRAELSEAIFRPISTRKYGDRELNEYTDIFLDAIRLRGSRNGNVVSLSSGWDSTAILACLVHIFGSSKVRAVTGRMHYAERSGVINQFEINRAKAVADYFGVHLDIVDYDYWRSGPDWVERLQPIFKSHCLTSAAAVNHAVLYDFVAKTTNGDETVFVGEISDGAHNLGFSQFVTIFHPVLSFREYSDKMASYLFGPTFLKFFQNGEFINDPIYNLMRGRAKGAVFDMPVSGGPSDRTRQLLACFFLRANRLPLWSLQNSKILSQEGILRYGQEMESEYLSKAAAEATPQTLYSWYLHLYNSFHWQSAMIASRAIIANANGLRFALPFWDSRIQEFLSAMPEHWGRGLDLNPTKYPLKWMLKNRIDYPLHLQTGPHSYLYDVDPSFSHSAEIMYGSAFSPYFKNLLRPRAYRALLKSEMFDLDYIDGVVSRFLEGTEVRGAELNDLFSLCMLSMMGWYGK